MTRRTYDCGVRALSFLQDDQSWTTFFNECGEIIATSYASSAGCTDPGCRPIETCYAGPSVACALIEECFLCGIASLANPALPKCQ